MSFSQRQLGPPFPVSADPFLLLSFAELLWLSFTPRVLEFRRDVSNVGLSRLYVSAGRSVCLFRLRTFRVLFP